MTARATFISFVILLVFAGASRATSYTLDPAKSTLKFTFRQAGAKSEGSFVAFDVHLTLLDTDPATNRLEVSVNVASLDTRDRERDEVLRSADLFAFDRFPTARFVATKLISTGPGRYEALGRLTIRDFSRQVRIPFTFRKLHDARRPVARMDGEMIVKRLEFGVGQGE
jgi:polyisoprenoid-binding protein YceI